MPNNHTKWLVDSAGPEAENYILYSTFSKTPVQQIQGYRKFPHNQK